MLFIIKFPSQKHPDLSAMKVLLVIALAALAHADVSHLLNQQQYAGYQYAGYQYKSPAPENSPLSSYGAPQASVLGGSSFGSTPAPQLFLPSVAGPAVDFNGAAVGGVSVQSYNGLSSPAPSIGISSFPSSTPAPSVDFSGFQVSTPSPNIEISNFPSSTAAPSVDFSGFQVSTPASIPSVNLVQYSQPSSSYQFLSQLSQPTVNVPSLGLSLNGAQLGSDALLNSGSGGSIYDAFGVETQAAGGAGSVPAPDVSKQLYFFAAPEDDEEEVQAKVELPPAPPKKTYKIIFIKAPTYRNQASITIPAPPQNEEKTLVYVLVKKPETQPKVRFQDAAPTQPTKPEVFFIKYKTQKEAEAAVAEIQNKHAASGQVISNLPAGAQAALQPGAVVSVSSAPPSLSFGGSGFDASVPISTNFETRISEGPQISLLPEGVDGSLTLGQDSESAPSVSGTEASPSSPAEESAEQDQDGEKADDSNVSENVIEQRIGGSPSQDNESQAPQAVGLASYGPPNY